MKTRRLLNPRRDCSHSARHGFRGRDLSISVNDVAKGLLPRECRLRGTDEVMGPVAESTSRVVPIGTASGCYLLRPGSLAERATSRLSSINGLPPKTKWRSQQVTREHYGISTKTHLTVAEAEARVREALSEEGFGVLTEIDVAETLSEKLGIDRSPYRILGACNPELANRALEVETDIGLLLPCNVIIYEGEEATVVGAINPGTLVELTSNADLEPIAADVRDRLRRVLDRVADAGDVRP